MLGGLSTGGAAVAVVACALAPRIHYIHGLYLLGVDTDADTDAHTYMDMYTNYSVHHPHRARRSTSRAKSNAAISAASQ